MAYCVKDILIFYNNSDYNCETSASTFSSEGFTLLDSNQIYEAEFHDGQNCERFRPSKMPRTAVLIPPAAMQTV